MRKKIMMSIGAVVVALGVYLVAGNIEKNTPSENDAQNIKQLVNDYSTRILKTESASITSKQLIVTDSDKKSKKYDLPKDEFFVSIAPYINTTHPCATHSLTGCQGEMVEEDFGVYIEDMDGKVIVDQTMTSHENGFIDLWLPRDQQYQVSIEHNGKTAKSELSTFKNDDTCVTTIQLAEGI